MSVRHVRQTRVLGYGGRAKGLDAVLTACGIYAGLRREVRLTGA
jgi:hypothetical protein